MRLAAAFCCQSPRGPHLPGVSRHLYSLSSQQPRSVSGAAIVSQAVMPGSPGFREEVTRCITFGGGASLSKFLAVSSSKQHQVKCRCTFPFCRPC